SSSSPPTSFPGRALGSDSRAWFPVLSVVRFPIAAGPSCSNQRAFPSHGRGRRFNPYSAHQQKVLLARFSALPIIAHSAVRGRTLHERGSYERAKSVQIVRSTF